MSKIYNIFHVILGPDFCLWDTVYQLSQTQRVKDICPFLFVYNFLIFSYNVFNALIDSNYSFLVFL